MLGSSPSSTCPGPAAAIEIFADQASLADGLAEAIASQLRLGIADRGWASMALAGGDTPRQALGCLASLDMDWSKVRVTLTDERFVETQSPLSNQRMLNENFFQKGATRAGFTPLWSANANLEKAADTADGYVADLLPFDVTMLGMGLDGHFASLFPMSPDLALGLDVKTDRTVIPIQPVSGGPPRISLTLAAILQSRQVILLATGTAKQSIIERAVDDPAFPISAVLNQSIAPVRILWTR